MLGVGGGMPDSSRQLAARGGAGEDWRQWGGLGQSQDYGQEQRVTLGKNGGPHGHRKELWAEVRTPGWQRICVAPKADVGISALGIMPIHPVITVYLQLSSLHPHAIHPHGDLGRVTGAVTPVLQTSEVGIGWEQTL